MYKISHIFEGIDLTEEQKGRIDESFNSAIQSKITEIEALAEDYKQELIQDIETKNQEYLKEHAYGYFERVAEEAVKEFMVEKAEQIEIASKTMLHENILSDLHSIFEKHGFVTPEVVADNQRLEEANSRIDNLIAESREKDAQIENLSKVCIAESVMSNLTESQKDRIFDQLMEISYINENQYRAACERCIDATYNKKDDEYITESKGNNTRQDRVSNVQIIV